MKNKVSWLMPIYNSENTVAKALDSLLAQDQGDFEIIAIDDGSDDSTPAILRKYQKKDRRIVVVSTEHCGIVHALNTGIKTAQGIYLARMDADDFCMPGRMRLQRDFLDEYKEIGLVSCRVKFGQRQKDNSGYATYVQWLNTIIQEREISLARFIESPLAHPSVMFRAELLQQFGEYRQGIFPEDYELWLRWLESGVRMVKLPDELLVWNDCRERLSRNDSRYAPQAFYRCKLQYLAKWLKRYNPYHPKIIVWGAGKQSRKRLTFLTEKGIEISTYVDVDEKKIGRSFQNIPSRHYSCLFPKKQCFIVSMVGAHGARKQIAETLENWGYRQGIDFILAA